MVWRKLLQRHNLFGSIAALILLLALLAGCVIKPVQPESNAAAAATEAPTEEATAEATEEPAEEATAEPSEEATEEPTEEATEEPTEEATEEPTEEPAQEGSATEITKEFAYVGTYTRGAPGGWSDAAEATHPTGVASFVVDPATGDMTPLETIPSDNPSWVTIDHAQDNLYVTNEIADYEGGTAGSIEAYSIDPDSGKLTKLNTQATSIIPAQSAVDPTDHFIVLANYSGGTFQLLPINDDGSLGPVSSTITETGSGPNTDRQEAPHPHSVVFDPSGKFIATADLGNDKIQIFKINDDGQLEEVSGKQLDPGTGPRHVAFTPDGKRLYLVSELSAQVIGFPFDSETGMIGNEIQAISTVADDFPADAEKSTAEIMVHPSGMFLYNTNRGFVDRPDADAVVAYKINPDTGELTVIDRYHEGINFPRGAAIDPTGTWLYALNQKGDTIVQFEINQETGELTPTGVVIDTPVPVSIAFKTK
jgi:6-phosphogluconolactonase (cycloisomerase 2 family)